MKQSGVIPKEFISLPRTPECFPLQIREVLSDKFFFFLCKEGVNFRMVLELERDFMIVLNCSPDRVERDGY